MFSIKHIDGIERTVAAVSYEFDPLKGKLTGHGSPSSTSPDGDIIFTTGRAYVMNDQGQTVGAYNLSVNLQKK